MTQFNVYGYKFITRDVHIFHWAINQDFNFNTLKNKNTRLKCIIGSYFQINNKYSIIILNIITQL